MPKLIPSLNGLRALSIFCVLIAHIQIMNLQLPDGPGGQIGVTVFFVISGFLITLLLAKEESSTGTISLKKFYLRRSLRLFPVFYVLLLVYFILQLSGIIYMEAGSWLSSITYTKYLFSQNEHDWETGHIWSLSAEEHFYLVWPLVFVYLKKFRQFFAIAVIAVVPFVRLLTNVPVMHLFTRADAMMWGCLFALNYTRIVQFVKARSTAVLLLPFAMVLFCLASKKLIAIPDPQLRNHFVLAFFGSFGTITNVGIAFIVVISVNCQHNLYFRFLNSSSMNYIGKLSYSIYLWQQLFFSPNVKPFSNLPLNLLCIAIVSVASYQFVEKPFLKLKDKFGRKKVLVPALHEQSIALQPVVL